MILLLKCAAAAVLSYLLGCISTSNIIAKRFAGKDIRTMGSGNAGTTNVLRNMGLGFAVPTFLGDCGKALVACLVARLIIGWNTYDWGIYVGGVACILGHDFPITMHFKGGKGVASTMGLLVAINPWLGLGFIALAAIANLLCKIYSLVSISTTLLAAIIYTVFDANAFHVSAFGAPMNTTGIVEVITLWFLVILMIYLHRQNLVRLFHNQEAQVEIFKKK